MAAVTKCPTAIPVARPVADAASWPSAGDYKEALQNPKQAFLDPKFQAGTVERYPNGMLKARSGAFASVYKLTDAAGTATAVRVFNYPNAERQGFYDVLSQYLDGLAKRKAKPGFLVSFKYTLQGVRVKGGVYPIQTMDWVKGEPLGVWYNARMMAKDTAAIRTMAAEWIKLVQALQAAGIAHGDLQHGNVMVRDGLPVLVDYDGMCVNDPRLIGQPATEAGLPAYQHPKRVEQSLGLHLDHFAAWIILIALRASANDPALYDRFVARTENENLLFTKDDLHLPAKSQLWPALLASSDGEVREWARDLRNALDKPFDQIPPFSLDAFARLRELCAAPTADWEAIQVEADRLDAGGRKAPGTMPATVPGRVAEARKKIAARTALHEALRSGDAKKVAAVFDPGVFANWPKHEGLVKQAQRTIEQGTQLAELDKAAASSPDGRKLVETWDRVKGTLGSNPLAQAFGVRADAWRGRIRTADAFLKLGPAASEQSIADAWEAVVAAGPPHPDLTASQRDRGAKAKARADKLFALRKMPVILSEAADMELVRTWDEALFIGCKEADPLRPRIAEARKRLAVVNVVANAIKQADAGKGSDADVIRLAADLPGDYAFAHQSRVIAAREGQERFEALKAALAAPNGSDKAIATEWERFRSGHPKLVGTLPPNWRERCDLAVRRRDALREFKAVSKSAGDVYERDKLYCDLGKQHQNLLKDSVDFADLAERIRVAEARLTIWQRLSKVLEDRDVSLIRPVPANLTNYPPVKRAKPQIDELLHLAERVRDILRKLESATQSDGLPLTPDDLTFLRTKSELFDEPTRHRAMRLLGKRLWPQVQLRASPTPYQLVPGPLPMAKVCWTWSGFGLLTGFEVASSSTGPLESPDEATRDRISRCRPEDYQRDGGGKLVVLGPGRETYVTIWPILDMGWTVLHGPPLHIGPILAGARP